MFISLNLLLYMKNGFLNVVNSGGDIGKSF